jgi:hypothetical protein
VVDGGFGPVRLVLLGAVMAEGDLFLVVEPWLAVGGWQRSRCPCPPAPPAALDTSARPDVEWIRSGWLMTAGVDGST